MGTEEPTNRLFIGIDFDGTCVENKWPDTGFELDLCKETLKDLCARGHRLILHTQRGPMSGIQRALDWFLERQIPLFGANFNPEFTTDSPKVYCHLYIDDRNLGIPLKDGNVDWFKVRLMLFEKGLI